MKTNVDYDPETKLIEVVFKSEVTRERERVAHPNDLNFNVMIPNDNINLQYCSKPDEYVPEYN